MPTAFSPSLPSCRASAVPVSGFSAAMKTLTATPYRVLRSYRGFNVSCTGGSRPKWLTVGWMERAANCWNLLGISMRRAGIAVAPPAEPEVIWVLVVARHCIWPINVRCSCWAGRTVLRSFCRVALPQFPQTRFCGTPGVFADALDGPARPEARAIKAAKRQRISAEALCLVPPDVMMERTFSSMPFIGGHFTMRLAAMTKSHRSMKTGIGDIAASASLLNKNSFTRCPVDTFYDEARCVFLLMRTCSGSQRTRCVSLGISAWMPRSAT